MSIDLHIHSTMSDGTLSPGELVELAHRKGLVAIAITDHDTVAGYSEAKKRGDEIGLEVISGLELSVKFEQISLHLLGYFIDCENVELLQALDILHTARVKRNHLILDKLADQGIVIEVKELEKISQSGETGRPHIAKLLMEHQVVRSMDEAFEKYLGNKGSAYVNRFVYDLKKGVDLIHSAGGIAVVAHPGNLFYDTDDESTVLVKLKQYGVDGLEAYYPTHSKKFRKQLVKLAAKNGLIVTGGSDYHGSIRKGTTLAGGRGVSVPLEVLAEMRRLVQPNSVNNR